MQYPFDGNSLQFEGTWYNQKTGDTVKVRDTLFENNQIIIRTNDGRMIPYDRFQNYVKVEKGFNPKTIQSPSKTNQTNSIPPEVLSEIEPERQPTLESFDTKMSRPETIVNNQHPNSMINTNIYDIDSDVEDNFVTKRVVSMTTTKPVVNINQEIIQKALKDKPTPKCKVNITWKDCPLDAIKALVDMFDISKDELVEYYNAQIDKEEIVEAVRTAILEVFTPKETKEEIKEIKAKEPKQDEQKKEKKPAGRPKGSGKKK